MKKLNKEIKKIIDDLGLDIKNIDWLCLSITANLSEEVIEEYQDMLNWYMISTQQKLSEPFIIKHQDKIDWFQISGNQRLSEVFIEENHSKLHWDMISKNQKLSESFIEKYRSTLNWDNISYYQELSESFIEKYQDKVNWFHISRNQNLSESFIKKFQDKIDWHTIFVNQNLSKSFVKKFREKVSINFIELHDAIFAKKSKKQKIQEMKKYAEKWNLKFDGEFLYAYREHNKWNRGAWSKIIFYDEKKYYSDWRCNISSGDDMSFGLGIWPEGNIAIKVKVDEWGCIVTNSNIGKVRVFGFEII